MRRITVRRCYLAGLLMLLPPAARAGHGPSARSGRKLCVRYAFSLGQSSTFSIDARDPADGSALCFPSQDQKASKQDAQAARGLSSAVLNCLGPDKRWAGRVDCRSGSRAPVCDRTWGPGVVPKRPTMGQTFGWAAQYKR